MFPEETVTPVDVCESSPCQNGGSCSSINGEVSCSCMPGYQGDRCQSGKHYCKQCVRFVLVPILMILFQMSHFAIYKCDISYHLQNSS